MYKSFESLSRIEALNILTTYQNAIDHSVLCSITDKEGIITYVNSKFCEVSKYTASELLGQNHRIINSGIHPDEFFKDLWDTISSGRVWRGEICSKAKDGTYFWQDSTIMPVYNELQEIHQYFSIRITIDHKKKLEEEREVYIRNLEEIIFQISHKVRQPVTQIIGLAKILSYNLNDIEPEKEELIKCINYILSATENLDIYTGDLATFTHESKVKINILV